MGKVFLAIYRLEGLVETVCISSMLIKVLSICGESEGITNRSVIRIVSTKRRTNMKAQHTYTENNEQLLTILNSMGDALIVTDQRGLITFMNPVAETLTGWAMEEASGKARNGYS